MRKKSIDNNEKQKNFAARAAVCYFLVLFLLFSCVLRVAVIDSKGYDKVSAEQSAYKIKVCRVRGTIYDSNMLPLTNNKKSITAVVAPTERALMAVSGKINPDESQELIDKLRNNKPAVCKVSEEIECEGVATTYTYSTQGTNSACHIVGYLDNTGHGAAGLEAAYDNLLYSDEYLCAVYEADGKGNILGGSQPRFENNSLSYSNYVVSTIDINMQNAALKAASRIKKGAVVVAEVKTAEIKVLLSLPQFDVSNLSASLNDENSPFVNRALSAYSVGSVFKSCVAAAGVESGLSGYKFNCEGSTYIIDRYFKCHKLDGHGTVDLRQALAFSCNCFFYNYAQMVGGEAIYKKARVFGFGSSISIADNIKTASGNLPEVNTLKNPARLANFSIGQGELTASPISLLPLYIAVANNGKYYLPSIVKRSVKGGEVTEYDKGYPTQAMSNNTANTIKEYLSSVISEGTAAAAAPKTVTAAGKTATAQTGKKDKNGVKINNSWFCGFFPAEEPKYVAVILSEGGNSIETTTTFAEIADEISRIADITT